VNTGETDANTAGVGASAAFLETPMHYLVKALGVARLGVPWVGVFAWDSAR
jgi:hypothetical protein